ncbi:MAG: hypothetical protein Q4A45_07490 [Clostridia bacterium]|nr:hypothetical protein [Clostridia bacterium]
MAEVEVKLYGELHLDSKIKSTTVNAENVSGIFDELNRQILHIDGAKPVHYKDALVYINGERCSFKRKKLKEKNVIWLMSPTIGG